MDGRRRERLWREVTDRVTSGATTWPAGICEVCARTADAATAITLRTESRAQDLLAMSGPSAADLEQAQYLLGEGPGVEAFTSGSPVMAGDLAAQANRWPMFADAALAAGVKAVFAFPLHVGAIKLGTLSLYRHATGYLTPAALEDTTILSDIVTEVVLRETAQAEETGGLHYMAAGSYQDVHIATGIVAAQLHISLQDASARLRAHAFSESRPLLDVSRDVVARRFSLDEWSE